MMHVYEKLLSSRDAVQLKSYDNPGFQTQLGFMIF